MPDVAPLQAPVAPVQAPPMQAPPTKSADLLLLSVLEPASEEIDLMTHNSFARPKKGDLALSQTFQWAIGQTNNAEDTGHLIGIIDKVTDDIWTYSGTSNLPTRFWNGVHAQLEKFKTDWNAHNAEFGRSPIQRHAKKTEAQSLADSKPQGVMVNYNGPAGASVDMQSGINDVDNVMEVGDNKMPPAEEVSQDGAKLQRAKDSVARALSNLLKMEKKSPMISNLCIEMATWERKLEKVNI